VKLLIAGGGTGGHVFPALAIAQEWKSRGAEREVVLVGTQRGIEMRLVPQAGLQLETLRVAGLKGKGGTTLLKNLAMLGSGLVDAFGVIKKHKPAVAFGVGGYAAGPMLLATWLRGIPNVIFEPFNEPTKLDPNSSSMFWADQLKPILTELLGPPAMEDHAPPPTGDPSHCW